MLNQFKSFQHQQGKISQRLLIIVAIALTALIAMALLFSSKKSSSKEEGHAEEGHAHGEEGAAESAQGGANEAGHSEEEEKETISLTAQQITEQGIQLAKAEMGAVLKSASYPAKIMVNTDRQAHVSPAFSGQVISVNVELGQRVQKGQALATLVVPDLVDQQANLQIAQTAMELARQDYERERQLWSQGISAKQDYQRAYNAYKQAQIQVQATKSRLSALGASSGSQGRYVMTAPIAGIISKKDLVMGENVQLASQLFVIDQLDQLWLEFIVPSSEFSSIAPNQQIEFKSLQTGNTFTAQIQSLNTEADAQTGRLQVRAKVLSNAAELRPNLMVNVQLQQPGSAQALRVLKSAIQKIEDKDVVFIASEHDKKVEFKAQAVVLGQVSSDGQWIEIQSGLKQGQQYAAQGSFLLKSELEKGEASHDH
ncbi:MULTISPECIES: efflux RND transporter periplasmic adaptor subunit [unclassified Acinetobacter]|uniref:efflux RND transporter periplasmic adaptor subunit n=1 Tax=unclassified Acinetobacter TaxID=196816 RepID=UPI0018AA2878|nr:MULTISPECIES: efflux RND transporter periplasmic adaptor subunit [unclassified Acinetobacter]MBJ9951976.1 efflux RND transporter periplasmic adaptor subunit [Acinetobacter baumannii]